MNMVMHELKALRKSGGIWVCAMIALSALFLSIYPSMVKDAAYFTALLEGYPASVREMLGIHLDYITSIPGYYSMVFVYIALCGAIQAMHLGASILSKEARERTADFLLVKPVSRSSIVSAKLFAAVTAVLAIDIVFFAVTAGIAGALAAADFSLHLFLLLNLPLLFIQLMFLAIGLAASVFFTRLRNVLPLSLGAVFGLYMAGALLNPGSGGGAVRYLSPFQYFDSIYIIEHSGYELQYLIAGAVIIAAAVTVSYRVYIRKDVHAV
ncbi:ABC transporter permease [Paenibacillus sp. FSL R7-0273]|uniref:ABC transporter permease subunit n=1 Tax=Paenibacillus sp. FSL R7-0273 TaxID=1536772 RepID=UPI0004F74544|nr:ABC transporter permease subunit [Paenibacillus sp. FSL R7-0273]AIQ47328.1 ABC transporter permease [Paenibacillus sp. FSL R7-0273]OMF96119.1 ABC transporter permease [Paenibacillus sp. FSL R7-0273]